MGNDIILEAIGKGNIKATMQMGGYDPTTEENLCQKNLMHFLQNVEFNNKQVHLISNNKMVLQNVPIKPSRNVPKKMIFAQGFEFEFWGEAVNTTVYIKN